MKTLRRYRTPLGGFMTALIALWQIAQPLHAATYIFDSDADGNNGITEAGGTFTWNVGQTTFYPGGPPPQTDVATANSLATDIAQFGNGGTLASVATVNVATQSINGLIFEATNTNGYTLSAAATSRLTIGSGGITMNSGAQATTVGSSLLGITIGASQTWMNNSANTLSIAGALGASNGQTLTFDGSGNFSISATTTPSVSTAITKNGTGTVTWISDPNWTGALNINDGVLFFNLSGTAASDMTTINVNGTGTLRVAGGAGLSANSVITLAAGATYDNRFTDTIAQLLGSGTLTNGSASGTVTTTLSSSTNAVFSGVIQNGATATSAITKAGSNTVTFTGGNTYTGATNITDGILTVNGALGSIHGTTSITVGDNNGATEVLNIGAVGDVFAGAAAGRLADAATITLNGSGTLNYNGPASGFSTETIGGITVSNGRNIITLTPGTGNEITLAASSISRTNNGILLLRGDNLGTSGTGNTRLSLSTLPGGVNFVGGGGANNSTTMSIVPWVIGDTSSSGAGTSFVTYDVVQNSLRPLTAGEYVTTISGASATSNVSLAAADVVSSATSINALRVTGTGSSTLNAATTVLSGAVLFTGSATLGGSGSLGFGSAQGLLLSSGTTTNGTINTTITGAGGLVVGSTSGAGNIITLGGNNTFTGGVTIDSGILRLGSVGALNSISPNILTLRSAAILELNGNNVTVLDPVGATGSIIRNQSATTAATLTINSQNASALNSTLANGGTAAMNIVKTGIAELTYGVDASAWTGSLTINQGSFQLSGNNTGRIGSTAITINNAGSQLRINHNNDNSPDRVANTAVITLNNTAPGLGLLFQDTQATNPNGETVGAVVLGAGHNVITSEATSGTVAGTLTFGAASGSNLTRSNHSTLLVLGRNLGTTAASTLSGRIVFTNTINGAIAGAETIAVGGGGGVNTTTRSIFPYMIGESTSGAPSLANVGNSFVAVDTNGLRPLNLTTEYLLDNAAPATGAQNLRYTASLGITTPPQINSLVLDSSSAIALTGSPSSMEITSGALLAVGAAAHEIKGFTGITTGSRDYTVFVPTSGGSLKLTSELTSAVSLVKAGAGTLILDNAGNDFTDLYFNQGIVQADAISKLGTGNFNFFGGTLRFGAAMNIAAKTVTIGTGGATMDTAGNNVTFAGSIGNSGSGSFTKIGTGTLSLGGSTYTGTTTVNEGRLELYGSASSGAITANGGTSAQGSFGGTSTVTGGVTLATNGATSFSQGASLNPGAQGGAAGTLTINTLGLTTNAFSTLAFDLNTGLTVGGGVNDLISTDILPVFAGTTLLNVNALTPLTTGLYTLFNGYTGMADISNITLGSITGDTTKSLATLVNNAGTIQVLVAGSTPAAAYWSGAVNTNWNSIDIGTAATNWRTSATGGVDTFALPGATTDVFFQTTTPVAGNLSTILGQNFIINTLTFTADATTPVSINGSSLTLNGAGGITLASGAGAVTIGSNVALGGAQTWTNNSSNGLTVDGTVSGNFNLAKAGTGSLTLNGASNSFVGTVTVSAGTLVAGASQALGLAVNPLSLNGGTLNLASDTSTTAHNTTVGGNFSLISNRATAGAGITHTLGTLSIGASTLTVSAGANVTSGTAGVTFGATTLTGIPTLAVGSGSQLVLGLTSGGSPNSTQALPASNTSLIIKGAGSVSLSSASNTFTGDILVDGGGYDVDNLRDWGDVTVANSTSKTITLTNGGRLNVTSGTLNPGALTTTSYYLVQIGAGDGTINTSTGAALQLDDAGQLFGSGTLTKTGGGTLSLRNQGGFTGALIIAAGTLQPVGGTGSNLGTIGAGTTIQSGAALNLNGISIAEAEPLTISGTGLAALPAGAITNSSGTSATFLGPVTLAGNATIGAAAGGTITLSGGITGAFDLTIQNLAAGGTTLSTSSVNPGGSITNSGTGTGTTTISALIGSSVSSIVQNSASSKLILSNGNNAFNFDVLIKQGTLQGSQNTAGQLTALGLGIVRLGDTGGSANATLEFQGTQSSFANPVILGTTSGTLTMQSVNTSNAVNLTGGITGNNSVSFSTGTGTAAMNLMMNGVLGSINNSGSLTNVTVTGTGALTIGADIGSNVTNIVQNSATSVMTLSGENIAFTGGIFVNAGTLNITGGGTTAPTPNALTVKGGAALNLFNNTGLGFNLGSGVIDLGAGTGTATLSLELGSLSAYDRFISSVAATAANSVVLNLKGLTGFQAGNYDLITAASGLSGATYSIGTLSGRLAGFTLGFTTSDTLVRLTSTAYNGNYYWNGGVSGNPLSWTGISGLNTNFTTDLAGTTNANGIPGVNNSVIFSTSTQTVTALATTLDAAFTIKDLTFNNQLGTGPLATISINAGTSGTLTITPASATAGISVETGAPAGINLAAPIFLGANQTWTVADATTILSSSGGISGAGMNLTKAGSGILQLSGTNSYTGTTTVSGGILRAGSTNGFAQNSAHVVNASGTLRMNGFSAIIGSLAGSGLVENNSATSATLTVGGNNTSTTFSGILQNGTGAGTLALTKTGRGTFTLNGANTYTGNTNVTGGTLIFDSGVSTTTAKLLIGFGSTAAGAVIQKSGVTLAIGTATGGTDVLSLGGTGGYGYYLNDGGTLSTGQLALGGNSGGTNTSAVFEQTGGSTTVTAANGYMIFGWQGTNANGVLNVYGGTITNNSTSNDTQMGFAASVNSFGMINMLGAGALMNTTAGGATRIVDLAKQTGNFAGVLNLNAGTLLANAVRAANAGTPTFLNFDGGTLKANSVNTTFINGLTAATIYSGGATIDTNGVNVTIPQALLAPTGSGVTSISVTDGGAGYIGAPAVRITGGGGTGATAIAEVDLDPLSATYGKVINIRITSAGTGYTSAPTVTLYGGGATTVATLGTSVTGATTSGGLTKTGLGTLTLSGTNTYTGGTMINAGTLALGANNALADAGAVTVNGGTFDVATFSDTVGLVTLQSGSITGTTGVLTGSSYAVQSGSVSAILAGSGGLTKTTAGTVTLSAANTYSGVSAINGGTLEFSTSGNLGNASATNTITLGGGTLRYAAAGALNLTGTRVVTLTGGTTSTVEVAQSTGNLQVTGGFITSAAANLVKTGSGNLTVTGALNLTGGNLTVSDGTYTGGLAASGIGGLNVGASGSLQLVDSAAVNTALTGLTLVSGARLGFELGAPGVNDSLTLAGAATMSGGTITLDFYNLGGLATGTYNLISAGSGLLGGGASYVLGSAPTGFNYVINQTDTLISVGVSVLSNRYWTNSQGTGSWSTLTGGTLSNFSTDSAGVTNSGVVPTSADTVIFSATSVVTSPVNTTLDAVLTIDSLVFNANPAGGTFSIAPGSGGSLTLAPVSTTNGISVGNNGGAVTISAPLTAGAVGGAASQTWFVDGTGVSSLSITGNVTFTDLVTKTGAGSLTLSGNNSGAGGLTFAAGTLRIGSATALGTGTFTVEAGTTFTNSSAGLLTLTTNNAQTWNGSFTFGGTQSLSMGSGAVTLGDNVTTTVSNTLTVGGSIDDGSNAYGLTKAGTGTLVLNGNNNYDGLTLLSAGTLTLAGNNSGAAGGVTMSGSTTLNLAHVSALGTGAFTINGGTLNNTSGGALVLTTNNVQFWNSSFTFTGTNSLDLGTGAVTLGATPTVTVTANTLTVGGVINGAFGITKTGAGTLTLTGLSTTASNNYSGTTTLDSGPMNINTAAALTGGLTFGSAIANTTFSSLNLPNGATFAGALLVQTNNATANTITLGSGQTLTLNGNVQIGSTAPSAANSLAKLTIGGGGHLNVMTAGGGLFQVGGSTNGAPSSQNSILDLTGLSTATINVTATGTVRVNQPNGSNVAGNQASLLLPTPVVTLGTQVTTITAGNFNIGDNGGNGSGAGQVNSVMLGTGLTTLNVNTVNIGTGARDLGELVVAAGNGTIKLRAADGTGRAVFNLGTGTANTGVAPGAGVTNKVDFTGHSADLLISTLTIGGQNRNTARTDTFTFDTGTLDATTVVVGTNTGTANAASASNTWTSTLNLAGGSTTLGTGGLDIAFGATAVTGTDVISGNVNISGGSVTIANNATFGAAIRMSQNTIATGLTANSNLNITGGSLTLAGHIIKGATTGAGTATVTLNGATAAGAVLDMGGGGVAHSIGGAAANVVTFNLQQGTLMNLSEFNGGAGLVKTTGGTVILENTGLLTNTYTGGTTISGGTLQVGSGSTTGTLGSGDITNNATLAFNRSNLMTVGNLITGSGAVNQIGSGTTVLTAANIYNGTTTVSNGVLLANNGSGSATGAGNVNVLSGAKLGGSGVAGLITGTQNINVNADATLLVGNTTGINAGGAQDFALQTSGAGVIILNGTVEFDLFGNTTAFTGTTNPANDNDRLLLYSGTAVQLGGTLKVADVTGNASLWAAGTWRLFDWSNITPVTKNTGTFTTFDLPTLSGLYGWDTSDIYTGGTISIVVVPEPSRMLLLMFGLMTLFFRRRRLTSIGF